MVKSVFKGRARAPLIHFFFAARRFAVAAAIFLLLTAGGRHAHVDHPASSSVEILGGADVDTVAQTRPNSSASSSEVIDDDEEEQWRMVRRRGNQFVVGDRPFYVNGFNAYWLMILAVDPSTRGKVTEVFQQAAAVGLTVCRSWAFNDGGWRALQKSPSVYDEDVFKALDFVVSEARKYRIRLILSLINNWDDYGGKAQYVKWARDTAAATGGGLNLTSSDAFFSDETIRGYYKNHVTAMATRVNTYTGVTYRDDPTIMAWELINEPRCASDPTGDTLQAWIQEMAIHAKSVDPDHLLEVGAEGFYGPSSPARLPANPTAFAGEVGADFVRNHRALGVDFASVHVYPDAWLPPSTLEKQLEFVRSWMRAHIADAEDALGGMPVVFTEFGASIASKAAAAAARTTTSGGGGAFAFNATTRDRLIQAVYGQLLASARRGGAGAGALLWQVFPEGTDYMDDGYGVVLPRAAATAWIMAAHSRELAAFNSRCAWSWNCRWGCTRKEDVDES